MEEIINKINSVVYILFLFLFIVIFYLSLKKCFLREGNNKVKLFFISLLTQPILILSFSVFSTTIINVLVLVLRAISMGVSVEDLASASIEMSNDPLFYFFTAFLSSVLFVLLIILFSHLVGKWLKAFNTSLVTYVYMMFSVIYAIEEASYFTSSAENKLIFLIVKLVKLLSAVLAVLLMHGYVIKALAGLTKKKRNINWKLFVFPPSLFVPVYTTVDIFCCQYGEIMSYLIAQILSLIILLLFIWAFYIIIKNINATNEAIEAKDLAAEMARTEALREADLNIAKNIQISALPSVFPPFPEHKEFELFASMNAAKEVGGDFYDFYMTDENTLGFLIADVSGKSIPGAMFMMTAKSTIKNLAENGMPPAEVFTRANEKLCEGNEAEMFVTAWLGYLDLKTGLVHVANAGHNPPVLIRGGKAEYVILKPGLMLAGMDGVRYKEQTMQLRKGDMLYLYTDGVTEAMDKDEEQYGEDRLIKLLSFGENYSAPSAENGIAEPVCDAVIADVRKFTDGAEQSDDITMLCVRYLGGE